MRTHVHELALAHVASPYILEGEYVPGLDELRIEGEATAVALRAARLDVIRCAPQHDRIRPAGVRRHVKRREQANAVAHRDVDLALAHTRPRPLGASRRRLRHGAAEVQRIPLAALGERARDRREAGIRASLVLEPRRPEPEDDLAAIDDDLVQQEATGPLVRAVERGGVAVLGRGDVEGDAQLHRADIQRAVPVAGDVRLRGYRTGSQREGE